MSFSINRRELFSGVRKAALAVTGIVAVGEAAEMVSHPEQVPPSDVVTVGQPAAYRVPSLTFVPEARAYLGRDALGFYAIDAVCPHLGCLVRFVGDGEHPSAEDSFRCPCHNSQYDAAGALEHGPATRGLRYLELDLDAGDRLVIRRDRDAHPSDRLIV